MIIKTVQSDVDLQSKILYKELDFSDSKICKQKCNRTRFESLNLRSSIIKDSDFIFCIFTFCNLENLVFEDCDLTGTKFYNNIGNYTFINCNLTAVNIELIQSFVSFNNCYQYTSLCENQRKKVMI